MSPVTIGLLAIIGGFLYYFYLWSKKKHSHWAEKGVPHVKPFPFFGSLLPVFFLRKSVGHVPFEAYRKYPDEKMVGYYNLTEPALIVRDPDLIEKIVVKDFQHFVDRPLFGTERNSIASKALFGLNGREWRTVRYKVSPAFTTGKLKTIFQQMDKCSNDLLQKIQNNQFKCDISEHLSYYALHTLASGVYGMEINDEKTVKDFTEMAAKLFYSGKLNVLKQNFIKFFPNAAEFLGLRFFDKVPEDYFKIILNATFQLRQESILENGDFVDFLIKLKKKGKIEIIEKDSDDKYLNFDNNQDIDSIEFTDEILHSLTIQFLLGGFHPLVQNTLYTIFELSLNPKLQDKARKQIKEVYEKHGGYTYAALKEMTYLDHCLFEVLRYHPIVDNLERVCTKTYVTSDGVKIEKGTTVMIPVLEIYKDPKVFKNAHIFDPDRHSEDETVPSVFMPFGYGPRICIGMRYAIVQMKVALAKIIGSYSFKLNQETKPQLDLNRISFVPVLENKILIDFTPL